MPAGRVLTSLALATALTACPQRPHAIVLQEPPTVTTTTRPVAPPTPPLRVIPFEQAPIDPRAAEALVEHFDQPPAPIDKREPPTLTKQALEDTARSEARGLQPEGRIHVVDLTESQRAVVPVEVATGDCITAIAHGGLGVMEVDAFVIEHESAPPRVLAQDTKTGPMAVVGGLAGCYPYVGAGPATLDVVVLARKGAGPVVFAAYRSKP